MSNCIICVHNRFHMSLTICLSISTYYYSVLFTDMSYTSAFTYRFYLCSRNVHSTWSTRLLSVEITVIEITKCILYHSKKKLSKMIWILCIIHWYNITENYIFTVVYLNSNINFLTRFRSIPWNYVQELNCCCVPYSIL